MSNFASFELCQELHQLSRWATRPSDGDHVYLKTADGVGIGYVLNGEVIALGEATSNVYLCPAYKLDYLMRKLPVGGRVFVTGQSFGAALGSYGKAILAGSPENAVAKLCIELLKKGTLPKLEKEAEL